MDNVGPVRFHVAEVNGAIPVNYADNKRHSGFIGALFVFKYPISNTYKYQNIDTSVGESGSRKVVVYGGLLNYDLEFAEICLLICKHYHSTGFIEVSAPLFTGALHAGNDLVQISGIQNRMSTSEDTPSGSFSFIYEAKRNLEFDSFISSDRKLRNRNIGNADPCAILVYRGSAIYLISAVGDDGRVDAAGEREKEKQYLDASSDKLPLGPFIVLLSVFRNAPLLAQVGVFTILGVFANILVAWGVFPIITGEWLHRYVRGRIAVRRRTRLCGCALVGLGLVFYGLTCGLVVALA